MRRLRCKFAMIASSSTGPAGIIWIASYLKSGNTWVRLLLANLYSNSKEPVSINAPVGMGAASSRWMDDLLGFDLSELSTQEINRIRSELYDWMAEERGTVFMKIHDALSDPSSGQSLIDLKSTHGVLYLVRNPLDVAHSLAAHLGISIDKAIQIMADEQTQTDQKQAREAGQIIQRWSSWSGHVSSWLGSELPTLTIRYEDLSLDPAESLQSIVDFLELDVSLEQIKQAVHNSRFEELRRQESEVGFKEALGHQRSFFRSGKVDAWREKLTEAQIQQVVTNHGTIMQRLGYRVPEIDFQND